MAVIEYDPPQRCIVGTVGPPGQRQFYLQVTAPGRVTTLAIEKAQVAILAERIDDLLNALAEPEAGAMGYADTGPLDMPVTEEFTVGTMALAWDTERGVMMIECHAAGDSFDSPAVLEDMDAGIEIDPADDPTQLVLRIALPGPQARAFARRTADVVAAGRPNCPFCAGPLDPEGHICPRANGYKR